jgi:hypothetical protein
MVAAMKIPRNVAVDTVKEAQRLAECARVDAFMKAHPWNPRSSVATTNPAAAIADPQLAQINAVKRDEAATAVAERRVAQPQALGEPWQRNPAPLRLRPCAWNDRSLRDPPLKIT